MKRQERMYDLHGIFRLHVMSADKAVLRHFDNELGRFHTEKEGAPDLEVIVGSFHIDPSPGGRIFGRNYVEEDLIAGRGGHKVARWQIALDGLQRNTIRLRFKGGIFSLGFLQQRYVEQLMRYRLVSRGYSLLHASCVALDNKRAVLFPSLPNTGKTALSLHLATLGWQFLSDDSTIVTADGRVFSCPRRLHFSPHKLDAYPPLASVRWRHRLSMLLLRAIRTFTLGYGSLTLPLQVQELYPSVSVLDEARLADVVFLAVHHGSRVEGPLPLRRSIAVERLSSINQVEMRNLWDLFLTHDAANGSLHLPRWEEQSRQILEKALEGAQCHVILIPNQVKDFRKLWWNVGEKVERVAQGVFTIERGGAL